MPGADIDVGVPAPRLNTIMSAPGLPLAALIASGNVQLAALHVPSSESAVALTVNVAIGIPNATAGAPCSTQRACQAGRGAALAPYRSHLPPRHPAASHHISPFLCFCLTTSSYL